MAGKCVIVFLKYKTACIEGYTVSYRTFNSIQYEEELKFACTVPLNQLRDYLYSD